MAIIRPELPPKAGYVERVDANGNHYYAPTAETLEKQQQELDMATLRETINTLLGVTE